MQCSSRNVHLVTVGAGLATMLALVVKNMHRNRVYFIFANWADFNNQLVLKFRLQFYPSRSHVSTILYVTVLFSRQKSNDVLIYSNEWYTPKKIGLIITAKASKR